MMRLLANEQFLFLFTRMMIQWGKLKKPHMFFPGRDRIFSWKYTQDHQKNVHTILLQAKCQIPSSIPTPKRVNFLVTPLSVDAPVNNSPRPSTSKGNKSNR